MRTDPMKVGRQIYILRKTKGLTQSQLGERLHISFQAVSKWERGETLPDLTLMPDLAAVLETTIDNILIGGEHTMDGTIPKEFTREATIAQMREGIDCFVRIGELLGKDSLFYYGAVGGVNLRMNMDLERHLGDPYEKEACIAEAATQAIANGAHFDLEDIQTGFEFPYFANLVTEFAKKYGIS